MIFAEVIIDISVKSLDRPFQYRVPEEIKEDAVIGALVTIPFGKGNREVQGYIIGLSDTPEYDFHKTKDIIRVEKQGVVAESHLLSLAYWIKQHYGATMNDAIKAVMPVRREVREKIVRRIYPNVPLADIRDWEREFGRKHNTARERLLHGLLQIPDVTEIGMDYTYAVKNLKVSASVIRSLEERRLIMVSEKQYYRNPAVRRLQQKMVEQLNQEQQKIVTEISKDWEQGICNNYLIHGVTGSGKTEVYMHLIQNVLKQGRQAIVLLPEIALTFQTLEKFYAHFGDKVSVMHSRLSAGERYDQFNRAKRGEIQIMIGPRSALFTPFPDLGLIIMDEEQEAGYQNESPPRYHAREVAVQRGKMLHASVVLGSATPSLEAYYRCQTGQYRLFELKKRAGQALPPTVEIVDLKKELAEKNYSIFSRKLRENIKECLLRKEQIMLFINRRGYAGFVSCRKCGKAIQCDRCSVSMKPHVCQGRVSILKCHYCGEEKPMPSVCPFCGSRYIGTFGMGTQKVEELVKKEFPEASVLRMDADTTAGKEDYGRILEDFAQHRADILVGTQMIVKGHDFENVTLVGVLAADLSLNAGDYRAAERTFQLLAQAAGRAGRGRKSGNVIFQTYQPEHYSIQCAAKEDYSSFYRQEISVRKMLHYPPVSNILEVLAFSRTKEEVMAFSDALKQEIQGYAGVILLGPVDAPVARLREWHRRKLFIKSPDYQKLCEIKDLLEAFMKKQDRYKNSGMLFDFNQ